MKELNPRSQTRIVLDKKLIPIADQILNETGIRGEISEAVICRHMIAESPIPIAFHQKTALCSIKL